MRHNEGFDTGGSTLSGSLTQESGVAQMRTLLSAFERGIEGPGALMECPEVAELRRELHSTCVNIRGALNGLSDRTLRLERATEKYMERARRLNRGMADDDKVLTGLEPQLWQRA